MSAPGVYLRAYKGSRDGATRLSVDEVEKDGGGTGYRLCGPKFDGQTQYLMAECRLTAADVKTLRGYLNKVKKYKEDGDA